jgi:hypothetical protein
MAFCRYDRLPGALPSAYPPSFGWYDLEGTRFAFYRAFLPDAQEGHPGNFSAHVIFGPKQELDASTLLRSYDTGWWWFARPQDESKAEPDTRLPALKASDIPQPSTAHGTKEQALQLLALLQHDALLRRGTFLRQSGRPLVVTSSPGDIVSTLLGLHIYLPILVNRLSFSTYEARNVRNNFLLVGTGGYDELAQVDGSPILTGSSSLAPVFENPALYSTVIERVLCELKPSDYPLENIISGLQTVASIDMDALLERGIRSVLFERPQIAPAIRRLYETAVGTYRSLKAGKGKGGMDPG